MTIEFQCDGCLKVLRTADEKAGLTARCPQCGKELSVPAAPPADFDQSAEQAPPSATSPLSDFANLTQAAPRRRPEVVEIICAMCGQVNQSTTDRCLSCGEPLEHSPTRRPDGTSTTFGDVWSRAWEIWTTNLGINVAAGAIAGGILFAINFAINLGVMAVVFAKAFQGGLQGGGVPFQAGAETSFNLLAMQLLMSLLSSVFTALFIFSLCRFSLDNVRRENPRLGTLLPSGPSFGAILGGMLLFGLLLFAASLPVFAYSTYSVQWMDFEGGFNGGINGGFENIVTSFAIGYSGVLVNALVGAILVAFFWPAPYLFMDRSTGLLQSVWHAPAMAIRFLKLSILLALAEAGLNLLGSMACTIGLIFSMPLCFILFAVAYDRCERLIRNEQDEAESTSPIGSTS